MTVPEPAALEPERFELALADAEPVIGSANTGSTAAGPTAAGPSAADADVPRPPRFLRIALVVFEVACWVVSGVLVLAGIAGVISMVLGTVPGTARLMDGATLIEAGGGVVAGGTIDVMLEGVPVAVSWPYLFTIIVSFGAWIVMCIALARVSRGLRSGVPFRSVTPRFLYAFAAIWTVLAFAVPFVIGATQPTMAQAAGVVIPGATFSYTMRVEDLLGILAGPIIAVLVAVLATGSRMWAEHRRHA